MRDSAKNGSATQTLDGYWRQAKAAASTKVPKNNMEVISIGLLLRHPSEEAAARATKQSQDIQESLGTILTDTLSCHVKVWDWVTPEFTEPTEPKLPRPQLIEIPNMPKLSEADAPSYSLKPREPVIRREDMPAIEVSAEPLASATGGTPPTSPQKHWVGQQFQEHPYICWGLVIAVLIITMSGQ
jgi:hypothetical protein